VVKQWSFFLYYLCIYMIFSAVARGLRAAAAQKNPPQFPQQESERDFPVLRVDEDTRSTTAPAASVWQEHLYPDEPLLRQEAMVDQKPYVTEQRRKAAIREKQPNRKEDSPRGARSQQRQVSRAYRQKRSQANRIKVGPGAVITG
jgi:hypothetical protein